MQTAFILNTLYFLPLHEESIRYEVLGMKYKI